MENKVISNKLSDLEKELYEQMIQSVRDLKGSTQIGIAFSGGVDSSLLAKITDCLGFDILLLTIGFEDSHDIEFAQKMAKILGFKHEIEIISTKSFPAVATKVWNIVKTDNLSWNENSIAFYYISRLAKKHNICKVLTANGIDELFCGYNSYREAFINGKKAVLEMMDVKLDNEIKMMKAVNTITSEFDVKILQPFLSNEFIEFAKKVPLHEKIMDANDLIRKHIVRKIAVSIGVPNESAYKRKKAMQYGSLIHKNLMKFRKTLSKTF